MSDDGRIMTPTKAELEKELHDAYAVVMETEGLNVPERRRAIERCRAAGDLGIERGYWKAPPGWWDR